ncbi:hypothetical protein Tco_1376253 [Tanacetum coccineum]
MASLRRLHSKTQPLFSYDNTMGVLTQFAQAHEYVVAKDLQIGYSGQPILHEDARKLIQACKDCQVHKPVPKDLTNYLDSHGKSSQITKSSSKTINSRIGARNYASANISLLNGDTPFSLTYETEAVILAEIGMPTLRTKEVNLKENKEALEINLEYWWYERAGSDTISKKQSKNGKGVLTFQLPWKWFPSQSLNCMRLSQSPGLKLTLRTLEL